MKTADLKVGEDYEIFAAPFARYITAPSFLRATLVALPNTKAGERSCVVKIVEQQVPADPHGRARTSPVDVREERIGLTAIKRPWADAEAERAQRQQRRNEDMEAYARSCEVHAAKVTKAAVAFKGIQVQPFSKANFAQDDVDLADEIVRYYSESPGAATTIRWEVLEKIAERLQTLEEIARQSALTLDDARWNAAVEEAEREALES